MYSLRQKQFLARKEGKTEVILTMEETDKILSQIKDLDRKLAECMPFLPAHVYDRLFGDMFDGPK